MADFIITCPNCSTQFEPGDSMRDEIQKELRGKMAEWQKKKDDEFKQKENSLQQQLNAKDDEIRKQVEAEKKKMQEELESSIRKSVSGDFENQLKMLQQNAEENEEKLKEARKKRTGIFTERK
jgi:hypothetical protein